MTIEAEQEQDALTILEDEREIAAVANLLAVIHGDGGHYALAHGWGRAIIDAEAVVVSLRAELAAVKRERNEWRNLAETRGAILGDMTP